MELKSFDQEIIYLKQNTILKSNVLKFHYELLKNDLPFNKDENCFFKTDLELPEPCYKWCFDILNQIEIQSLNESKIWIRNNFIFKIELILCFLEFCLFLDFEDLFELVSQELDQYLANKKISLSNICNKNIKAMLELKI